MWLWGWKMSSIYRYDGILFSQYLVEWTVLSALVTLSNFLCHKMCFRAHILPVIMFTLSLRPLPMLWNCVWEGCITLGIVITKKSKFWIQSCEQETGIFITVQVYLDDFVGIILILSFPFSAVKEQKNMETNVSHWGAGSQQNLC